MTISELRYAHHPNDVKHYTTEQLREHFLIENLFQEDCIKLTYSMYDRFIVGGVKPITKSVELETIDDLKATYFLERRELGIVNVGGNGTVKVDGVSYSLEKKEALYVGKGSKEVVFKSDDASQPALFY